MDGDHFQINKRSEQKLEPKNIFFPIVPRLYVKADSEEMGP